jgi:hypothetical protein
MFGRLGGGSQVVVKSGVLRDLKVKKTGISWVFMRSSWNINEIFMGFNGNLTGYQSEFHGISWEFNGISVVFNGV